MERGTHVNQAVVYHQHPEAVTAPPVPKVAAVQTSGASGPTAAGVVWPEAELLSTRGLCYTCSVTKSRPTLCNPVDRSMPGSAVLHCLLEFAQILVH